MFLSLYLFSALRPPPSALAGIAALASERTGLASRASFKPEASPMHTLHFFQPCPSATARLIRGFTLIEVM